MFSINREDNFKELMGEENYRKLRIALKKYSSMEEGPLKDTLLRQIYCDNNDIDPDFRCRKFLFLDCGNIFTEKMVQKTMGFLESSENSTSLKREFLLSIIINSNHPSNYVFSRVEEFCYRKFLEDEDGKTLAIHFLYKCFTTELRKEYGRVFISRATQEDAILTGLNQGCFTGDVAEAAVLRMWSLKQDKGKPEEWVKHILKNVAPYKDSGFNCALHVYAALVQLFPDVFTLKDKNDEENISALHCMILCMYKGKEWRKLHRESIKNIFSPGSFFDGIQCFVEYFTPPVKEFIHTCLEFGDNEFYPGESSFYLSRSYGARSGNVMKILFFLNQYLDDEYSGGDIVRAIGEVREFVSRFRGEEGVKKYMTPEWQRISCEWNELNRKMGTIMAETRNKTGEVGPGEMVM